METNLGTDSRATTVTIESPDGGSISYEISSEDVSYTTTITTTGTINNSNINREETVEI
ncbi:MAG: hypothetical protein ACLFR1_13735 [Spirochaetia bacterium]